VPELRRSNGRRQRFAKRRSVFRPSSVFFANPLISGTSSIHRFGCCWLPRPAFGSLQGQFQGQLLQRLIADALVRRSESSTRMSNGHKRRAISRCSHSTRAKNWTEHTSPLTICHGARRVVDADDRGKALRGQPGPHARAVRVPEPRMLLMLRQTSANAQGTCGGSERLPRRTGQTRNFRPSRPVSSTSFTRRCANPSALPSGNSRGRTSARACDAVSHRALP